MTISQISQRFDACFLVDNGSFRPEAALGLRSIAGRLTERAGFPIEPVSVLHSSKISVDRLDGQPAEIFETAIAQRLKSGKRSFLVIPFFFGPSRALTEFLPEKFSEAASDYPDARLVVAEPLAGNTGEPDQRIAQALLELTKQTAEPESLSDHAVVLVDHGTPVREVTAIRDGVGAQLKQLLDEQYRAYAVSSMERRPEPEYEFNEPLLESVLRQYGFNGGPVIIAHLFLLPGRHAGADGDIAEICSEAKKDFPEFEPIRTQLLGEHPLILDILYDRLLQALRD